MFIELQDKSEWHEKFVLFPMVVSNTLVWWDYVEQREVFTGYAIDCCDGGGYRWEYRLIADRS